ncbi:MAG: zinc ABC transporter substrate-binding protein [Acidobacteriota bacterium]
MSKKQRNRAFACGVAAAVLSAVALVGVGCAPPAEEAGDDGPKRVVATTGMIADTTARIVGDLATVEGLMGPGVDPHLYKASESDVRRLSEADLILFNGLFLEGKMGDILVKLARSRPVVAVSETVPEDKRREPPELEGQYDPHIWFDVSLWAETVGAITDALVEILPAEEATLRANAERVRVELLELDAWVVERIESLPPERRVLVTAHDAFGYFGDRYGLEVIGVQGISTLAEAGLQDVDRVVDLVVERRIPALFVESSVPRRTVEAVVAAAQERGHAVTIGGELYSDAMGAAGTPEGTYDGMVRHNVTTIVDALRGEG